MSSTTIIAQIVMSLSGKNVFNRQKTMFLSGDSHAVDSELLYFTYAHSRSSQKITSSTVTCIERT